MWASLQIESKLEANSLSVLLYIVDRDFFSAVLLILSYTHVQYSSINLSCIFDSTHPLPSNVDRFSCYFKGRDRFADLEIYGILSRLEGSVCPRILLTSLR